MAMKETKTIILAAGKGTRMRSKHAKVLHRICGKSLVDHVIRANHQAGIEAIAVIVGYQAQAVRDALPDAIETFEQAEQLGTGHAVAQALPFIEDFDGNVLILVGDAPLVRPETLKGLIEAHEAGGFAATVLTAHFDDPTGYGRIVKDGGALRKIVEERDASAAERAITEINSGMYCFDAAALREALAAIQPNNAQGEYYLTDSIEILRRAGKTVGSYPTPDFEDIVAVNSKGQLAEAAAIMRRRINGYWLAAGALIVDPANTYLSCDTQIGRDAVIEPGVVTEGRVIIGEDALIGSGSRLTEAVIGEGAVVMLSTVSHAAIAPGEHIGPYAAVQE